jgi:hypothetical protein
MGIIPLNTAVGGRDLCAWSPVQGVVWIQTRHPLHGRRLSQRKDGRLVVRGVAGGYLMTYEFLNRMGWAIDLMERYQADLTPTNAKVLSRA